MARQRGLMRKGDYVRERVYDGGEAKDKGVRGKKKVDQTPRGRKDYSHCKGDEEKKEAPRRVSKKRAPKKAIPGKRMGNFSKQRESLWENAIAGGQIKQNLAVKRTRSEKESQNAQVRFNE